MRYLWQHIRTIIESYDGTLPLAHFLKQYYKQHPKLGSRDRKILTEMAYSWYRCSKGLDKEPAFEDAVKACLHITGSSAKYMQPFLPQEKPGHTLDISKLFPFDIPLSDGIAREKWLRSMLQQPDVFLRLRNKALVLQKLEEHHIPVELIDDNCIAIPNGSPVDKLLPAHSYVVQDASSQKTTGYFAPLNNETWWDCCSGAGGKSLALSDENSSIKLTVTDKRSSILHNLVNRFKQYHLPVPEHHVLDVSDIKAVSKLLGHRRFDNIICDVPCTGSGTWARTPEQLYFFHPQQLTALSSLQSTIATNASKQLKPGGKLFYITCSVFRQENEDIVNTIISQTGLQLIKSELINGIKIKADNMFIAVLQKE